MILDLPNGSNANNVLCSLARRKRPVAKSQKKSVSVSAYISDVHDMLEDEGEKGGKTSME